MRPNNQAVVATDATTKTSRVCFAVDLKSAPSFFKASFVFLLKFNSLTIVFVPCYIANPLENCKSTSSWSTLKLFLTLYMLKQIYYRFKDLTSIIT